MRGSRSPRFRLVPPARDRSAGRQAIQLARSIGIELDGWQQDILMAGMGRDRAGRWCADEVVQVLPRQNGKSVGLLARTVWGVTLGGEKLALFSAHQQRTSYESFLELVSWCETDALAQFQPKVNRGRGNEAISFAGGGRIVFISRSRSSGRGFSPDTIVLDEAFALDDRAMAALKPAMSARKKPQAWFASSAPHPESTVLRRYCLSGREGIADRLVYLEWSALPDAQLDDERAWAVANPALGTRLTEHFTRSELAALEAEDFARERLGIWHEEETQSVFPHGAWEACLDVGAKAPQTSSKAIAVDVSPDRRRAAIGAAGALRDGRILVEVIDARDGVSWVVGRVAELAKQHGLPVLVDGIGQSQTLIAPLEAAGVTVRRTQSGEMVAACGAFHDRVTEKRLAHLDQPELTAAVEGAKQRPVGDGWAWNRRTPAVDLTPLVACSLALHGVETATPEPAPVFVV